MDPHFPTEYWKYMQAYMEEKTESHQSSQGPSTEQGVTPVDHLPMASNSEVPRQDLGNEPSTIRAPDQIPGSDQMPQASTYEISDQSPSYVRNHDSSQPSISRAPDQVPIYSTFNRSSTYEDPVYLTSPQPSTSRESRRASRCRTPPKRARSSGESLASNDKRPPRSLSESSIGKSPGRKKMQSFFDVDKKKVGRYFQ